MKLTTTIRKKFRVRNKLKSVAKEGRLRLCVSRSTKNISAQIIDDSNSKALISASSSAVVLPTTFLDMSPLFDTV